MFILTDSQTVLLMSDRRIWEKWPGGREPSLGRKGSLESRRLNKKETSHRVTFSQSPSTCQFGARETGSDQNHMTTSDMGSKSSCTIPSLFPFLTITNQTFDGQVYSVSEGVLLVGICCFWRVTLNWLFTATLTYLLFIHFARRGLFSDNFYFVYVHVHIHLHCCNWILDR